MIKEILNYAGDYRATSLKNLQGREGSGWGATILKNGVEIGSAFDYGDGASVRINIYGEELKALDAYAASKAKQKDDFEKTETFLDNLVNYEFALKRIKTVSKKSLIIKPDNTKECDENGVPTTFEKYNCLDTQQNRDAIKLKNPTIIFLNDDLYLIEIKKEKKVKNKIK